MVFQQNILFYQTHFNAKVSPSPTERGHGETPFLPEAPREGTNADKRIMCVPRQTGQRPREPDFIGRYPSTAVRIFMWDIKTFSHNHVSLICNGTGRWENNNSLHPRTKTRSNSSPSCCTASFFFGQCFFFFLCFFCRACG